MTKNTGMTLLIVGSVMTIAGAGLASVCTPSQYGFCSPTPISTTGLAAAVLGGGLFLAGLILVSSAEFGRRAPTTTFCPVCGKPMAWITGLNRWFCSKCDQYR